MTHYLIKNLNQVATYWGNPSPDGWGGQTFDSPVAIDVRWVDKQQLFISVEGKEERSKAVVYVDQDVDLGGFLYLGTSAETNPEDQDGALEIGRCGCKIKHITRDR